MKNIKIVTIAIILFSGITIYTIHSINESSNRSDIKKFTDNKTWCGSNELPTNPQTLPGSGCFVITGNNSVLGQYKDHNLRITRYEDTKIMYILDGVKLDSKYDPESGQQVSTSPFATTKGTYSWKFCNDKEHLDCPLEINFLGDSADKSATSSIFAIANCIGGEKGGTCNFGKTNEMKSGPTR